MSLREEIYGDYLQQIRDHYRKNRQAAEEMREELNRSPLISRGRLIDMPLAIQKIYTQEDDGLTREQRKAEKARIKAAKAAAKHH